MTTPGFLDEYTRLCEDLAPLLHFLCRATGEVGEPDALETLDVGWFALDALPPLSTGRVDERQLRRHLAHHRDPALPTEFD